MKRISKCSAGCGASGTEMVSGFGLICGAEKCQDVAAAELAAVDRTHNTERPVINAGMGATLGNTPNRNDST